MICNLRSGINAYTARTAVTHHTKKPMIAIHNNGARAERGKNAPVPYVHLAWPWSPTRLASGTLEGIIRGITVYLTRRDETCQYRFPQAEEAQKDRIPLEYADIEQ